MSKKNLFSSLEERIIILEEEVKKLKNKDNEIKVKMVSGFTSDEELEKLKNKDNSILKERKGIKTPPTTKKPIHKQKLK